MNPVTASIEYLSVLWGFLYFFFGSLPPLALFLAMSETLIIMSWNIPSGHRKEQYTLPNRIVTTIRIMNAAALPEKMETRAGVNCVLNIAWESGLPPLMLRKPHVMHTNTIVAAIILKILGILFIAFVFWLQNY